MSRPWLVISAVAVVVAAGCGVFVALRGLGGGASAVLPPRPTSSNSAMAMAATPMPTPPGYTPDPGDVSSAPPTQVSVPSLNIAAKVLLYTVDDAQHANDPLTGAPCYQGQAITCVDPPTADDVYWQEGGVGGLTLGDAPGTNSQSNVYLFGHASRQVAAVFTHLYQLKVGSEIDVTTSNGVLKYHAQKVLTISKGDYTSQPEVLTQVPGRLLLVTCYYGPGATFANDSSTKNVVVVAQLVSGHASP